MPEQQLIERLLQLSDTQFRKVVDDETRNRVSPNTSRLLNNLIPPSPERTAPPQRGDWREREEDPSVKALVYALTNSRVVERWYMDLSDIKRNVEGIIAAKRADMLSMRIDPDFDNISAEYHKWRAGTLRFVNALEGRLALARHLTDRHLVAARAAEVVKDRDDLGRQVLALKKAIRLHKSRHTGEVTAADLKLWKWVADE